jgi:transcriptional regulator with XRE-family HTH domain
VKTARPKPKVIKRLREDHGWLQEDLVLYTNEKVKLRTIQRMETERRPRRWEYLECVARALGVPVADIVDARDVPGGDRRGALAEVAASGASAPADALRLWRVESGAQFASAIAGSVTVELRSVEHVEVVDRDASVPPSDHGDEFTPFRAFVHEKLRPFLAQRSSLETGPERKALGALARTLSSILARTPSILFAGRYTVEAPSLGARLSYAMAVVEFVPIADPRVVEEAPGRIYVEVATNELPTPLVSAVRSGDLAAVKAMLAAGADPNAPDAHGERPLHAATSDEIVRLLADHGADPSAESGEGLTPLEVCGSDNYPVVLALLDAGSSPDTVLVGGRPLIVDAVRRCSFRVVAALLALGADPTAVDEMGEGLDAAVKALVRVVAHWENRVALVWRDIYTASVVETLFVLSTYGLAPATAPSGDSWLTYAATRFKALSVVQLVELGADPTELAPVAVRLESRRRELIEAELELVAGERDYAAEVERRHVDETLARIAEALGNAPLRAT